MHRTKKEVTLRILAQESLDLELWLERYEFLKFWSYFWGFSEARDLFVNIFQTRGSDRKIMDCGLILEKQRGLSAKSAKLDRALISKKHKGFFAKWRGISAGIYFSTDKAVDQVHASMDRLGALGPPWTDGGADRGGGAEARRRAHWSSARASPAGAQQREERTGSSARASSGLGRHRGGRATAVKARRRQCSVRGLLRHGERGKEAGRGVVKLGGGARLL
jgi:hypothetical protein